MRSRRLLDKLLFARGLDPAPQPAPPAGARGAPEERTGLSPEGKWLQGVEGSPRLFGEGDAALGGAGAGADEPGGARDASAAPAAEAAALRRATLRVFALLLEGQEESPSFPLPPVQSGHVSSIPRY